MLLIDSQDALARVIPNCISPVKGERPLYDKMLPFIEAAQEWAVRNFCPESLAEDTPLLASLIGCEAYRRALPALNVVLTPNGLATVGNATLVAASAARTSELLRSMAEERDALVAALLDSLIGNEVWADSRPGAFWSSTLFPSTSLLPLPVQKWDSTLHTHRRVRSLEARIAREYISPELLSALRRESAVGYTSAAREEMATDLRDVICTCLTEAFFDHDRLTELTERIRTNPEEFPEWQETATAHTFSPDVFTNKKEAGGYFFLIC